MILARMSAHIVLLSAIDAEAIDDLVASRR